MRKVKQNRKYYGAGDGIRTHDVVLGKLTRDKLLTACLISIF